jgi:hypothetical protein
MVEQKLDRLRIEAASLAIELNQAERDLEEARSSLKPKTAERIAKLDAELVQTRSDLVRERERREQVERDYDAASLQSGGQLKQLRQEAERARAEADRANAAAAEARAELEGVQEQLTALERQLEAGAKESAPPAEPDRVKPSPVEPSPSDQLRPVVGQPEIPIPRRGKLKRGKRMFETRGRTCAVCRRTEAASPGALQAEGWALGAEIDICRNCGEKGWQLPKGGSLPFRRSSARRELG